ncbi:hypothetical protein Tco_1445639, partial [Tanacetum coccineum]
MAQTRFHRRPTAKGVGLRVADSYNGNHPEDDFTPLETIRRLCSVFGRRSPLGFERETSEPKGRLALEKAKSQGYKDAVDGLREEVTQFVGSGVESLVRKLLSSDEFHVALAHVASLGINYGVERGLRMGRS